MKKCDSEWRKSDAMVFDLSLFCSLINIWKFCEIYQTICLHFQISFLAGCHCFSIAHWHSVRVNKLVDRSGLTFLQEEGIGLGTGLMLGSLINVSVLIGGEVALLAVHIKASWDLSFNWVVSGAAESLSVDVFALDAGNITFVSRDMLHWSGCFSVLKAVFCLRWLEPSVTGDIVLARWGHIYLKLNYN